MAEAPEALSGYKGTARERLDRARAKIGDLLAVQKGGRKYEGYLMPRSGLGDDLHLVLKLKNGYNIGLLIDSDTKIEASTTEMKPTFTRPPPPKELRKDLSRVCIISTGGTISSRVDYRSGAVEPALTAEDLYRSVPELSELANVETEILYSELSENMSPEHWAGVAESAFRKIQEGAQGIVVCMGTDTLGYTAAALSFALQNLPVPLVVVASQRSSDRPSSDAPYNLTAAVWLASNSPYADVLVAMHEGMSDDFIAVHRGTKARKCHTSRRDAFISVNTTPLARFNLTTGQLITLDSSFQARNPRRTPRLLNRFDSRVALVKFYPGMQGDVIEHLLDGGYRGLIIEGTGLGHVAQQLHPALLRAKEQRVFVGMTSQCLWGRVNMNIYYTGVDLQRLGVVPLDDVLPETATVKLMWALGQTHEYDSLKDLMLRNIAGESTPRTTAEHYVRPVAIM